MIEGIELHLRYQGGEAGQTCIRDSKNTGRPLKEGKWFEKFRSNYLDVDNDALYPFGYGLSYTTFRFSDITLNRSSIGMDNELVASVTVTNTGDRAGSEVVQLYIRDLVGSVTRPVKELKGFEKIYLQPNESRTVRFTIAPEMLKFYNADLKFVAEPGDFDVMIGPDSRNVKTARSVSYTHLIFLSDSKSDIC